MNILDHISESLETIFWVKTLKISDAYADPDPGSGHLFDPGSGIEKFGSGINIPDAQPWLNHNIFRKGTRICCTLLIITVV
jgi:hypothetical protein